MRKLMPVAALAILVVMVAFTGCSSTSASQNGGGQYEAMSPWADADPIPLRGISPRIDTLEGKKIGVFANSKRSAPLQAETLERKLKERFPTIQTEYFRSSEPNVVAIETAIKDKFLAWLEGLDAVILAVGD